VRSIGACYTYINEERAIPFGLHERILQATLGTTAAEEVRAPFAARIAARLRLWLDPIVSPQLATVATMLLVCVLVLTSTVSADGSIGGMYSAGIRLAERAYTGKSNEGIKDAANSNTFNGVAEGMPTFLINDNGARKEDKQKSGNTTNAPRPKERK
jgi:hypothetical protein